MPAWKAKFAPPNGSQSGYGTRASAVRPSLKPYKASRAVAHASRRANKNAYDAEQWTFDSEIDTLQVKLSALREKTSSLEFKPSGNDKENALRPQLDCAREQQSSYETFRGKVLDQFKMLEDGIQKKVRSTMSLPSSVCLSNAKDLQAARGKTPFRSVAEEKRAFQEILHVKRTRKIVEGFQASQDSIDADRSAADELRQKLDDPESKAISERYSKIKAELNELKRGAGEAYANRIKLSKGQNELQGKMSALLSKKRVSAQRFREANNQDRPCIEKARGQRVSQKRSDHA